MINTSTFDSEYLGYIDFLEAIVRVAKIYPFQEEVGPGFENKLRGFIKLLEEPFKALIDKFVTGMN